MMRTSPWAGLGWIDEYDDEYAFAFACFCEVFSLIPIMCICEERRARADNESHCTLHEGRNYDGGRTGAGSSNSVAISRLKNKLFLVARRKCVILPRVSSLPLPRVCFEL